jgi:hypothetical protein
VIGGRYSQLFAKADRAKADSAKSDRGKTLPRRTK